MDMDAAMFDTAIKENERPNRGSWMEKMTVLKDDPGTAQLPEVQAFLGQGRTCAEPAGDVVNQRSHFLSMRGSRPGDFGRCVGGQFGGFNYFGPDRNHFQSSSLTLLEDGLLFYWRWTTVDHGAAPGEKQLFHH